MRVRDLMRTRSVLSVRADDDVALAAQLLRWGGVRHLPVTDQGAVVGGFSERACSATGRRREGTAGSIQSGGS
jgi:predicted transcriptional regulator